MQLNRIVLAIFALAAIIDGTRAALRVRRGYPLAWAARVRIALMWLIAPIWPIILLAAINQLF